MDAETPWSVTRDTETGREEIEVRAVLRFTVEDGVVVEDEAAGVTPTLEIDDGTLTLNSLQTVLSAAVKANERLDCVDGDSTKVTFNESGGTPDTTTTPLVAVPHVA